MNLGKSRLFALAAAHGASLLAVPAVLQAAPAEGALEEIVVTARQREERIENVPVSITAFTAADIRSAGIDRPQDFIALTPGMAQVQTAEVGDLQVTIRGINTGRDAEPNFALVIDGVLQTNPNALNQELANVTQIEVLKGPQGAVYGRNALAGALIVFAQPAAAATATFDFNAIADGATFYSTADPATARAGFVPRRASRHKRNAKHRGMVSRFSVIRGLGE